MLVGPQGKRVKSETRENEPRPPVPQVSLGQAEESVTRSRRQADNFPFDAPATPKLGSVRVYAGP